MKTTASTRRIGLLRNSVFPLDRGASRRRVGQIYASSGRRESAGRAGEGTGGGTGGGGIGARRVKVCAGSGQRGRTNPFHGSPGSVGARGLSCRNARPRSESSPLTLRPLPPLAGGEGIRVRA